MTDPLLTAEPIKPGIPIKRSTLITIAISVLLLAFIAAMMMDSGDPAPQQDGQNAAAKKDGPKQDVGSKVVIDEEVRKAKEAVAEVERKEALARGENPNKTAPGADGQKAAQVAAAPAPQVPSSPLPAGVQRKNQDAAVYEKAFNRVEGGVGGAPGSQKSEDDARREREHESDYQGRTSRSIAFDDGASMLQQATSSLQGAPGMAPPVVAQSSMSRIPDVKPVVSQPASASMQGNFDRISAALQGQGNPGQLGAGRTGVGSGNAAWLNEYAGGGQGKTNEAIKSYPTSSKFTLHQGKAIPAVLGRDINSQLPGEITAYVTSDVYDSLGNGFLLIPKGAVLVGRYNSEVKMGQERVMFAFQRIILPNGVSFDLPGAQGMDSGGASGVEGDVNNHFFKMFAASFFTAWLADRVQPQSTTTGIGGVTTQVSPAGQVLVDVSRTILDRNKTIQPTITVAKGTRINIEVKKDMEFAGPYNRSRN